MAQICRRLDGIPLAIELAVARLRGLTLEQLADRLDDHLRLLTSGNRAALPRHQTLRAMVDWSYALLSEPERSFFRRLAVFAGGWTLGAAERVCAGEDLDDADILELLLQLVERSLVLAEERPTSGIGETRYRLLETLRQYGAEKLEDAGESAAMRARHLTWCIDLVNGPPTLLGPVRGAAHTRHLQALEAEHDNLREALRWSLVEAAPEAARRAGQRLVAALWPFWWVRSHLSEGARWQQTALAVLESDDESDRHTRATVLIGTGVLGMARREHALAAAWVGQGQTLLRPGEDPVLSAHALAMLGLAAEARGEIARATEHYEESLALTRTVGMDWVIGWVLGHLGRLAMLRGEYKRATTLLEESLVLCRELASPERPSAYMVHYLGVVASELGHPERAARLFGAAEGLRNVARRALSPADRAKHRRHVDAVRQALCSQLFEAGWAAGQAMSFERAVEYALTAPKMPWRPTAREEPAVEATAPAPSVPPTATGLADSPPTARELEVTVLLARGLINRQISEELIISERTASTHVTHILNKLSFSTRSQVAVWAEERGVAAH